MRRTARSYVPIPTDQSTADPLPRPLGEPATGRLLIRPGFPGAGLSDAGGRHPCRLRELAELTPAVLVCRRREVEALPPQRRRQARRPPRRSTRRASPQAGEAFVVRLLASGWRRVARRTALVCGARAARPGRRSHGSPPSRRCAPRSANAHHRIGAGRYIGPTTRTATRQSAGARRRRWKCWTLRPRRGVEREHS